MQVLLSILKGDQNYHYENVAFLCRRTEKRSEACGSTETHKEVKTVADVSEKDEILGLAPMIDHEFSTYYMFPDHFAQHKYVFDELQRSISGAPVTPEEYAFVTDETERKLMEASAVALHHNLVYIKTHYPEVTRTFLEKLTQFETDLTEHRDWFELQKNEEYPDMANSFAFRIGMARYKEKDEEKAALYEAKYAGKEKRIDFAVVNSQAIYEIKHVIRQMKEQLHQGESEESLTASGVDRETMQMAVAALRS